MNIPDNVKYKVLPGLLLGGLFLAGFLVLGKKDTSNSNIEGFVPEKNEEIEQEEKPRFVQPENILQELAGSPGALQAELVAVDGSGSTGTGYLLFSNNMTLHAVVAQLPEPAEGNVYEGWLVQPEPLKFFSTGVMEEVAEGSWVLEYARAGDYPSHTKIVITEEEELDGIPETHILEGNVK